MPSSFFSKFRNSTESPSRPQTRALTVADPRSLNAAPLTPRLVLSVDGSDDHVHPPSPPSIHRADSPATHSTPQPSPRRSATALPLSNISTQFAPDAPTTTSPTDNTSPPGLALDLAPHPSVKRKSSSRSVRSTRSQSPAMPPRDDQPPRSVDHRPHERHSSVTSTSPASMRPIVESPVPDRTAFDYDHSTSTATSNFLATPGNGTITADSDAASIRSTSKKAPWRRSSTSTPSNTKQQRRPTGLAGALAASGMALANPGVTMQPPTQSTSPSRPSPKIHRSNSSTSLVGPQARSRQVSASSNGQQQHRHHHTSSNGTNGTHADDGDYYSDMSSESGSELDLNEDDIPVTGFAVASSKRNADFHELFQSVPEGDYLIEDYGCALQREILIQGRFYISENHICFHANIFGWITDLTIPVYEIIALEKKMTAFVIPNAIQVTTRTTKYTFASFLARDTTYDVVHNIWRLARPDADEVASVGSARASFESSGAPGRSAMDGGSGPQAGFAGLGPGGGGPGVGGGGGGAEKAIKGHRATQCTCGKEGKHYTETAMEVVVPGTPEKIYNLMFASGFIKDFMREDQKLLDVQISDWYREGDSKLLSRNFSYIKPLSGGLGPKQTKCELKDETVFCDFDDYVATVTTTRTPDVPSGSVFSVKTRTCIMWAGPASTRVIVTSQVEWTGRSFIKSIIERSALEGQKTYHADLERAMRLYIAQHTAEFIPEGMDVLAVADRAIVETAFVESPQPFSPASGAPATLGTAEAEKIREHERNQRGLQWAWDTATGAWKVARESTAGALDLIGDAWDQSSSTTILIFIIVVLVMSNLWTLMMVGKREELGRRKEMRKVEERERWVQGVVAALWEEMAAGRGPQVRDASEVVKVAGDWRDEVGEINQALDAVEARVRRIRAGLQELD